MKIERIPAGGERWKMGVLRGTEASQLMEKRLALGVALGTIARLQTRRVSHVPDTAHSAGHIPPAPTNAHRLLEMRLRGKPHRPVYPFSRY